MSQTAEEDDIQLADGYTYEQYLARRRIYRRADLALKPTLKVFGLGIFVCTLSLVVSPGLYFPKATSRESIYELAGIGNAVAVEVMGTVAAIVLAYIAVLLIGVELGRVLDATYPKHARQYAREVKERSRRRDEQDQRRRAEKKAARVQREATRDKYRQQAITERRARHQRRNERRTSPNQD